ncbi:hypothetical protein EJ08DRAFT_737739 [Tothia fuscella]|uniref:Uncharacterized protein n=1 Tax=Tothia fuscella TaxID=1048955 RepID=A0A9P4NIU7_9PEZI|nr:hypothetical protein EJ08DRAFT_737739 [Tothia fuscella]
MVYIYSPKRIYFAIILALTTGSLPGELTNVVLDHVDEDFRTEINALRGQRLRGDVVAVARLRQIFMWDL